MTATLLPVAGNLVTTRCLPAGLLPADQGRRRRLPGHEAEPAFTTTSRWPSPRRYGAATGRRGPGTGMATAGKSVNCQLPTRSTTTWTGPMWGRCAASRDAPWAAARPPLSRATPSLVWTPKAMLRHIRGHWEIENRRTTCGMLGEDASRAPRPR